VQSIRKVDPRFHARFDAKWRTYRYHVHTDKNPFKNRFSTYIPIHLNVEVMNKTTSILIGKHDFTSFSKVSTEATTAICDVKQAEWICDINGNLYFEITANRFLRNMVRAIVGNLMLVGQGKIMEEEFLEIFTSKDRALAKGSADAQGLFLWEVQY
jgi:tRNA pseudouridine38-40 synthase